MLKVNLPTPESTVRAGRLLGDLIAGTDTVVLVGLSGELGAGKTSFVSGVLSAFGVTQGVRSPTYTLIEPYELGQRTIYHLDLYRLRTEEELEDLGVRELLVAPNVLLVEWIQRSRQLRSSEDLHIHLEYAERGHAGRLLRVDAITKQGEHLKSAHASALSQE